MKTRILWAVAALVLLAGCQKFGGAGKAIRFSAVTVPEPQTKTAYSGVLTGGWERIDWSANDEIRIYSDKAVRDDDGNYHWADYKVKTFAVGSDTKMSEADDIAAIDENDMLVWGTGAHKFVGVYPNPGTADAANTGTGTVTFTGTIPSDQTGALSTKTIYETIYGLNNTTDIFYPSNATMYLTSYADGQTESGGLTLPFSPAFTAFHINAGTDQDMTIQSVTLTAETNPIAGDFTGTCTSSWAFSSVSTTKTITLSMSDYALVAGETVDIVILALPLEMTGLTLTFNVTVAGTPGTRSLALKVAKATTLYGHNLEAGDYIIFNPCNQAYLTGLIVPGWNWTVNDATTVKMQESVEPWDDQNSSIVYGDTDPVINAGKLSGTNPYNFNVYSPVGKQWKVTVLTSASGGSVATGVTVTRVNKPGSSSDADSGSGELTGTIGGGLAASPGLVEFSLSGPAGTYWLSFSVIIDGVEYSINSEVARMANGGPKNISL